MKYDLTPFERLLLSSSYQSVQAAGLILRERQGFYERAVAIVQRQHPEIPDGSNLNIDDGTITWAVSPAEPNTLAGVVTHLQGG